MSERGVFAVDRGIWDHDLLAGSEPFSRREAWLWLVSEAAWKPHRRRIVGKIIELERGQLAASYRFIASKWQWSEPRVRRFIHALISEGMIDATTDAGVSVITISNYNEYQRVSLPDDASREVDTDAGATQERRKVEDREYKEEKEPSLRSGTRASKIASRETSRGTRLPDDWQPDDAGLRDAIEILGSTELAREELLKFRDHWTAQPGQRGVKTRWPATWRNWCRKAVEMRGRGPPKRQQQPSFQDIADEIRSKFNAPTHATSQPIEGEFDLSGVTRMRSHG